MDLFNAQNGFLRQRLSPRRVQVFHTLGAVFVCRAGAPNLKRGIAAVRLIVIIYKHSERLTPCVLVLRVRFTRSPYSAKRSSCSRRARANGSMRPSRASTNQSSTQQQCPRRTKDRRRNRRRRRRRNSSKRSSRQSPQLSLKLQRHQRCHSFRRSRQYPPPRSNHESKLRW